MTQWEYRTLSAVASKIESRLNELGQQGWEVCGISVSVPMFENWCAALKRPVEPHDPADGAEINIQTKLPR